MPHRAVFMDRDNTIIEDPGYLSDPEAVKLLPGVELAIKSIRQAGYKVVVVTNQSAVARGLMTEENLETIHAELRRQLAEKGAHLDGIYYCPFHPEGTVEKYTKESELRKPRPGMLLKAAEEIDIDLTSSWMIGDSGRDVEAGQRAGCRTIRVRLRPSQSHTVGPAVQDEDAQADYTVRNLVDAARLILRAGPIRSAGGTPPVAVTDETSTTAETMDDSKVRQEILRCVRQLVSERGREEFSFTKLLGGILQMLTLLALLLTFWRMLQNEIPAATLWGVITVVLQLMALTFFIMQKQK